MSKLIGLIQARDGNTRLPGKALLGINGLPMIQHVYNRAKAVRGLDEVAVSTSVESKDIINWCRINAIPYFAGPESDLLARHIGAMSLFGAERFVRITADCPFHDPTLIDGFLTQCGDYKSFVTNWPQRSVSEGLDLVYATSEVLWMFTYMLECPREDWAGWWVESKKGGHRVSYFDYQTKGADLHLSVDTPDDLERARKMMAYLGNDEYRYEKTLEAYEATK